VLTKRLTQPCTTWGANSQSPCLEFFTAFSHNPPPILPHQRSTSAAPNAPTTPASAQSSPTPKHKGGVIVLNSADAIDLQFLRLDPLDPPLQRLSDQTAEDAFCQRLLLLGAKWWDSEARYDAVSAMEDVAQGFTRNLDEDAPTPTMREKRLIKVAWPSTGGVWVADFDTTWAGVDEEDRLLPDDADVGRLKMARTMDERAALLRDRFGARHYGDIGEFEGYGYFNCWETKDEGEVGPLFLPQKTRELWERASYGKIAMPTDH